MYTMQYILCVRNMRDFRDMETKLFIFAPLVACYTAVRYLVSAWMDLEIGRKRNVK
jgi:hypothetical protein